MSRARRDDDGSMTVLGLFVFIFIGLVGAIALDIGQLYHARTQLQVVADQVGHAAIYRRDSQTEAQAISDAVALGKATLPTAVHGETIKSTDIIFGKFDYDTKVFTPDPGSKEAVRVLAYYASSRGNPASSYLFRLVGFSSFDVVVESVWQSYRPPCANEGMIAGRKIDLQSNNSFGDGFCAQANDRVEMNNWNSWGSNSTVSMPDKSRLVSGGYESNPGLEDALKDGYINPRVLSRLDAFRTGFLASDPDIIPSYITNTTPINVSGSKFDAADFPAGRIYNVSCPGTRFTLDADPTPLAGVVIVTDCKIKFGSGAQLQNAVILSTNTSGNTFTAPSGLTVGLDDNCAAGGGASLMTYGGMDFAAKLQSYGGLFLAKSSIAYAANANGMEGVSMIAGVDVSGTSNMGMGSCQVDQDQGFQISYFRMGR